MKKSRISSSSINRSSSINSSSSSSSSSVVVVLVVVLVLVVIVVVVVVVENEERVGEGRHKRWRGSISGRGCYGVNNCRLKRKNKGPAVHHRDFRLHQGFAEGTRGKKKGRSDEEAEATGREGLDQHTHTYIPYAATYRSAI